MPRAAFHPFVTSLARVRFSNCFNPYSDVCDQFDFRDASRRRSEILSNLILKASSYSLDALWVGRDLGYRGGRRTGLALTDDAHIYNHCRRWDLTACRPTKGPAVAERTATTIWNLLDKIDSRIFLWNVFPLHPHEPDQPLTNRQHNSTEKAAGEEILRCIVDILRPRVVVAIGLDAAVSCERIAGPKNVVKVRHPSYGGQAQFIQQIEAIYAESLNRLL